MSVNEQERKEAIEELMNEIQRVKEDALRKAPDLKERGKRVIEESLLEQWNNIVDISCEIYNGKMAELALNIIEKLKDSTADYEQLMSDFDKASDGEMDSVLATLIRTFSENGADFIQYIADRRKENASKSMTI